MTTGKNIPVIAMTANVFQEDESQAAECGMRLCNKPIDMNVIYSVLEKMASGTERMMSQYPELFIYSGSRPGKEGPVVLAYE